MSEAKRFHQIDDYETSTRICPCGSSVTWGRDKLLLDWMAEHRAHVDDPEPRCETSADGMRAFAPTGRP